VVKHNKSIAIEFDRR